MNLIFRVIIAVAALTIGVAWAGIQEISPTPNSSTGAGWVDNGTDISLQTATDAVVVQSTLTVGGNAFSVGVSTLVVANGGVRIASLTVTENPISGGVDFSVGVSTLYVVDGQVNIFKPTAASDPGAGAVHVGLKNGVSIVTDEGTFQIGPNSSYAGQISYTQSGSTMLRIKNTYAAAAAPIAFNLNGADRVTFLGSGNVGIGTASPSSKLEVVGDITATSSITIQGNAFGVGGSTFTIANGLTFVASYTSAQLDAIGQVPITVGGQVWNSTIGRVCYSSGTAAGLLGQYARVSDDTQCR